MNMMRFQEGFVTRQLQRDLNIFLCEVYNAYNFSFLNLVFDFHMYLYIVELIIGYGIVSCFIIQTAEKCKK